MSKKRHFHYRYQPDPLNRLSGGTHYGPTVRRLQTFWSPGPHSPGRPPVKAIVSVTHWIGDGFGGSLGPGGLDGQWTVEAPEWEISVDLSGDPTPPGGAQPSEGIIRVSPGSAASRLPVGPDGSLSIDWPSHTNWVFGQAVVVPLYTAHARFDCAAETIQRADHLSANGTVLIVHSVEVET